MPAPPQNNTTFIAWPSLNWALSSRLALNLRVRQFRAILIFGDGIFRQMRKIGAAQIVAHRCAGALGVDVRRPNVAEHITQMHGAEIDAVTRESRSVGYRRV